VIGAQLIKHSRSRSHIAMNDAVNVRRWTKHLKVTKDELQCAIDKVGNSVVAIRKHMGIAK